MTSLDADLTWSQYSRVNCYIHLWEYARSFLLWALLRTWDSWRSRIFLDSGMSLHKVQPNVVRVWRIVSSYFFLRFALRNRRARWFAAHTQHRRYSTSSCTKGMFENAVITATYQTYCRCLLGLAQLKTRNPWSFRLFRDIIPMSWPVFGSSSLIILASPLK